MSEMEKIIDENCNCVVCQNHDIVPWDRTSLSGTISPDQKNIVDAIKCRHCNHMIRMQILRSTKRKG